MKLKSLLYAYLDSIKPNIKRRTYLFYLQIIEIYITSDIDKCISGIDVESLNEYMYNMSQKYSYSTVKLTKYLINRALEYGFNTKVIDTNLKITYKLKQLNFRHIDAFNKNDQDRLERYIIDNKKYYYYGILISLYTGLRIGELVSLKWENIDFKEKIIFVESTTCEISYNHKTIIFEDTPKTNSSYRVIPISSTLIRLLRELLNNSTSQYVVSNKFGNRLNIRTYQQSFSNLLVRLNISHQGFHSLRHTFATRLLEKGIDIKTISELLGHSSPTITLDIYVHSSLENKRKAVDIFAKKIALG